MAHQIMESDWMFSANGIRPWHGLGSIIEEAPTTEDAIRHAKLDWRVEKKPVLFKGSDGKMKKIPDQHALIRSDTDFCCGFVKNRYEVVQNTDAFSFVDEIMSGELQGEVRYETAGSLYNGKRVFLLVRMPDSIILDDTIENYLFFTNSHDGHSSVRAGVSNVRIVCDNTLQMALRGAIRSWSAPHTKNIKARQAEAIHSLKLANKYLAAMPEVADKMAVKKIDIDKTIPLFFSKADLEKDSVQMTVATISAIAKGKPDLQNFKGTAWGVYNAVADYISHPTGRRDYRSPDRKMDKFLLGHQLLCQAQKVLMSA